LAIAGFVHGVFHVKQLDGQAGGLAGRADRLYILTRSEEPMSTPYDTDVLAWANEQAALLRAGNLSALDIQHIADEVEDVGKSEKRELANRMAILLTHLLKWDMQRERREINGRSWLITIKVQRRAIALHLEEVPSLKATLRDPSWWEIVWGDAVTKAAEETGLQDFPDVCPWSEAQVLDPEFLPN
jgi:hypothetical protein